MMMPQTTPTAAEFRSHFPVLEDKVHLASCSQGALSREVTASLARFQQEMLEHPNPWEQWSAEVERARQSFASLINAQPAEIAIISCASEGAYQVASGFRWRPGDAIVTSSIEFPSIAHVWLAQQARGATVTHAEPGPTGLVDLDSFAAVIRSGTRLVAAPLIAYGNGQRLPVRAITDLAHQHGARVFIDAYQGLGVEPIDVNEIDCDYLVAGALKYGLGIPGIAFLYVRAGLTADLDPQLTGWWSNRDPFSFNPYNLDFASDARRFQTGSPPVAAAYAARAGLELLSSVGIKVIAAHVASLTHHLQAGLAAAGFELRSPFDPMHRGPQVCLAFDDPAAIAAQLEQQGIATSPRGRLLRLAIHYYNLPEDTDKIIRALTSVLD